MAEDLRTTTTAEDPRDALVHFVQAANQSSPQLGLEETTINKLKADRLRKPFRPLADEPRAERQFTRRGRDRPTSHG
jgi:hypothetical protein